MAVEVDVVILAGGEGRRLGGVDKGWVEVAGRPLVQWMLEVVRAQSVPVNRVWLSANRHADRYAALGLPVLADREAGFRGPLAGIDAAFAASDASWLWVLPCDTPCLSADTLAQLQSGAAGRLASLAVVDEEWHPTVCLAHRDTWPVLTERLAAGQGAVRGWLTACDAGLATFADADAFENGNTPDALVELARRLETRRLG